MALANIRKALRVPGQLCVGATNLAIAFPHGGTALGVKREMSLRAIPNVYLSRREGFGKQIVEGLHLGEAWSIAATFRTNDKDVLSTVFFGPSAGASGETRVQYPGTSKPGLRWSTRAVKLVFSPDDDTNHRFVIFYAAMPMPGESMELVHRLQEEQVLACAFIAIPDGSGRFVDWGKKGDVTVT